MEATRMEDPLLYDFLWVWTMRAALCVLALLVVAILLLWRVLRSRSWRIARYSVLLLDALTAIAVAVYADNAWTTYQWYRNYDLGRRPPYEIVQQYMQVLAERSVTFPQWGWAAVGVTAALVMISIALAIKEPRAAAVPDSGAPPVSGRG
jgi:hypothetical protein